MTENQMETESNTADSASSSLEIGGLAGVFGTSDHKNLGRLYIYFGLMGGMLAFVLNILVRFERLDISSIGVFDFGSSNQFFQTWSLSRTSLLFFCVLPLLVGLATYLVPLQLGAPSLSFPRAASLAFWAWLIGILIHVVTVFADGGLGVPEPVSQFAQGMDPEATELSMLSIAMVVFALLLATICVVATVISQRPKGMTLFEVPLFSWSMLVAGGIWVLALPVWLSNLAISWVDFQGNDALRYGTVENIWDQLSWLWSQPMIFAFAIPVLGIAGDILPVSAGVPQRRYRLQQIAIGALGVLSFGAFAQPFFNPDVADQAVFVVMGLLVIIPIFIVMGGLADTAKQGKPIISAHLILAVVGVLSLFIASVLSIFHVSGAALGAVQELDDDWLNGLISWLRDVQGTVIATAVMEHALVAAVIGSVAGLYYWAPKIFGCRLNRKVGILAALAFLGGLMLSGGSNAINGILDEGDEVFRSSAYDGVWEPDGVEFLNLLGIVGSMLLLAGAALVLLDIVVSVLLNKGDVTDANDPWGGHTLEWATDSPPPVGNFPIPPVVDSERPLLSQVVMGGDEA
ncbi:MAG: cbb3-type cytochrome c oxidase subunit I [Acidimicrobiales bacterium]|nr:cbb3-type cytochrome c oxidase subunit I [Acidimicrobiales bacterium]